MSHTRYDEICDELVRLHHKLESVDGSRSLGAVSADWEKEAKKIRDQMTVLECELSEIETKSP